MTDRDPDPCSPMSDLAKLAQDAEAELERQYNLALAAGVVQDRAGFDELAATAGRFNALGWRASLEELIHAMTITPGHPPLFDDLGFVTSGPTIPQPDPDPDILRKLGQMYGSSPAARDAAHRTAVAMTRRRDGWTMDAAWAEYRARAFAAVQDGGPAVRP